MFKTKESYLNYFIILLLFSSVLFFSGIGFKQLWKTDETRVAGISVNMQRTGDYLVPRLNGKVFLEYPPMYYWATATSYNIFGKSLFASRLASAISALGTLLLIFFLSKKMLFDPFFAFLSGIILATCGQFWAIANRCIVDMMLCFFISAAMLSFFCIHNLLKREEKKKIVVILWLICFSLSLGFGMLTKSLIGLAVPSCTIFFWLISENIWRKKLFLKSWFIFIIGCIFSFIPVLIWLLELYKKYGISYVKTVAVVNTFERFTGSYSQHANSAFYYFGKVPAQFMPWTVILVAAILVLIIFKKKISLDTNYRFLFCWIIFPFIFFSLSEGKRPIYLLALYPAFAILLSMLIQKITTEISFFSNYAWKKMILIFSTILFFVFIVASFAIALLYNNKYTYWPLFKYYINSNCSKKTLFLCSNIESIKGAVNYYLNENVPIITQQDIKEILARKNTTIITPYFKGITSYGTVKSFKVKGDIWCILEKN